MYKIFEKILKEASKNKCEKVAPIGFSFDIKRTLRNKEIYRDTIILDFENMKIPAPIGYDEMLKTFYGDYMTPRKESNIHGDVFFDTEQSYRNFICKRGE